jgi:DNA-binding HxlR family transcriptional regulator
MRSYGQYCPIARGSEIFAERWTPIILRNILAGCRTFSEIAAGAPGLSRALLTKRLHDLQRVGVISARPKPDGRGSLYEPTPAGEGLRAVLHTLGMWADQWMELTYEHADPGAVLWSWSNHYLERDRIPERRIVIRFEWTYAGRNRVTWLLIERREAEICPFDPGFGDDLVVAIIDPLAFSRWHLGLIDWETALRSGDVEVTGPASLRRALPTWNGGPQVAAERRMAQPAIDRPTASPARVDAATN